MMYRVFFVILLLASGWNSNAQTALPNGGVVSAVLSTANEVDTFSFSAQAGDSVQIRVADTDAGLVFPSIEVFDPGGTLVGSSSNENVAFFLCDGSGGCSIDQTGTYTMTVTSTRPTATGNYTVHYTNIIGASVDGTLINGGFVSGAIDLGDIDAYTFDAQAGDSIQIRVADTDAGLLFPVARLYNPDGSLLASNSNENVSLLLCDGSGSCTLSQSGTYTLVVDDGRFAFTGNYDVHYTNIDGALADGVLINGDKVSGTIELGDIDAFTFDAQAGDSVQIRVADTDAGLLFPVARLYNPDGTLLAVNSAESVTPLVCDDDTSCNFEQTGTYTLVVDDGRIAFTGNYDVYLTQIPGTMPDGELLNGSFVSNDIELGDLDAYTFEATAGDSVQIRIADTDAGLLFPAGRLYNPDGSLLLAISGEAVTPLICDGSGACAIEQTGTYTLVISDGRIAFTGNYDVHFVRVPGVVPDAALMSGDLAYGTIALGDLDSYTISAQAGDSLAIRITDTGIGSLLFPAARLYAPDGTVIASASSEVATTVVCDGAPGCSIDQTGNYTLVISDGRTSFTGSYVVELDVETSACVLGSDTDGDQVLDSCDNCLLVANASQIDADDDGTGNACDADFNQDCVVNVIDLGALRAAFFSDDPVIDLNNDGVVNVVDLGILRTVFFTQPGPSGVPYCGS